MRVVVDCSPGIDDAIALALALSRQDTEVHVEAITVVDGQTSLNNAMLNLAVALKYCGRTDIPVYKGCASPMLGFDKVRYIPAYHFHGERGLGTYVPNGREINEINVVPNKSAAEGLIELAHRYSGSLNVITLGPLTNIALAIRLDPTFPQHLAGIFIMGGDYGAAFKRLGAEFNFFKDPEAANIVLREAADFCQVTLIPYDTCFFSTQTCHWDWFDSIVHENTDFGRYFHKLYVPYRNNASHFACCDGVAMAAMLLPYCLENCDEYTPHCGVQLDYSDEPAKTKKCPGGQRGCLVLDKKIRKEPKEGSSSSEDTEDFQFEEIQPYRFGFKIGTQINEHMFKSAFAEMVTYYSHKALPHYGY